MKTEKELIKLAQKYLKLEKIDEEYEAKEPETWREKRKLDRIFERILRKKKKLPKYISIKVGNFRISCSVNYGWIKVKKTR
jgi:ferritin-like metal-binding protein YciE